MATTSGPLYNSLAPNPMATPDEFQEVKERNGLTTTLLLRLQERLSNPTISDRTFNRPLIEEEVSALKNEFGSKVKQSELEQILSPEELNFYKTRARFVTPYGNTAEQIQRILQHLIKEAKNPSAQQRNETCLDAIIDPLITIKENLPPFHVKDLFRAVEKIDEKDLDRAVRLFYSQTSVIIGPSSGYTFEHARNQVQAIRFIHFETEDFDEYKKFVKNYRTFDEAHAFLRNQLKARIGQDRSSSSSPTPHRQYKRSIVTEVRDSSDNADEPQSPGADRQDSRDSPSNARHFYQRRPN